MPAALVPQVDPNLVQVVQQVEQTNPVAQVRVIVYGADPVGALTSFGAADVQSLDLIGAASGTVAASDVGALGLASGVDYVVVDSPIVQTDTGTTTTATDATTTTTATVATTTADTTTTATATTTTTTAATTATAAVPAAPCAPLATLYPCISGATAAWAKGLTGAGVGVAVIDSGVIAGLPDFGGRVTAVQIPGGQSGDAIGHGTFVTGVLAGSSPDGSYVGIAPGADAYVVDVAQAGGVHTSDIVQALAWVLANARVDDIRVVNLSLAETTPSSYKTSALDQAVEQLWKSGIVVVVSAGNAGANTEQYAPANDPFAITVGASDSSDTLAPGDDTLASFSSYGTTPDGFVKPDVVATGRHVVSTLPAGTSLDREAPAANHVAPGYVMANGTSFSAPQVSGAVALLLQQSPSLTPDQVKWLLVNTARPVTGSNAPGLDIAALIGYSGQVGSANGGIQWSNGHDGTGNLAKLNAAGNRLQDALAAAQQDEAAGALKSAGDDWSNAASSTRSR